jgi:Flp pilus assembly protein TadG
MVRKILRNKKGQGLVEFALILPLLLLLLFGIVELGRVMGAGLMANHSARDGARYGSVGASDSEIISRIQTKTASTLYDAEDPSKLSISIVRSGPTRGGDIKVTVSYPVTLYIPLVSNITGNPVVVQGTSVMRVE